MLKYLAIGIGGFLGSIARYWLSVYVSERIGTRLPYGTFVVNMSACFFLGFVMAILTARTHMSDYWRFLVPIGFIGAYSTFSTWEYEMFATARIGNYTALLLNVVCSVVFGFIAVCLGSISGNAVSGGPPQAALRKQREVTAQSVDVGKRAHRAAAGAGESFSYTSL